MRIISRPSFQHEYQLWKKGNRYVVGLDEVGRGAWAGPVVVGAVVFPRGFARDIGVADSKLLRHMERVRIADVIKTAAVAWAVTSVSVAFINREGIGQATQRAFRAAINALSIPPDFVLVDAFFIRYIPKGRQQSIKKGDQLCSSIAAASILAKVHRDLYMRRIHHTYPEYGFGRHKGYGTRAHREAIRTHGFCSIHRTRFNINV